MYSPSSENKGADQLRGNREADLRLRFHLCRLLVFPWGGSIVVDLSHRFTIMHMNETNLTNSNIHMYNGKSVMKVYYNRLESISRISYFVYL